MSHALCQPALLTPCARSLPPLSGAPRYFGYLGQEIIFISFIYLFGFGCTGSLLQLAGFSLPWLLFLWSVGSRAHGLRGARPPGPAGFSSCGTQAQFPHRMWGLPGPVIQPVSRALAGGFLTTGPLEMSPGKLLIMGPRMVKELP